MCFFYYRDYLGDSVNICRLVWMLTCMRKRSEKGTALAIFQRLTGSHCCGLT